MKMGVEAERRGEQVDRKDGWQEAVVKARRRVEERAERLERERGRKERKRDRREEGER